MDKYLPGNWDERIGDKVICDELACATLEISNVEAELEQSWELIQLRMKHPYSALTFENAKGHLLLVPGNLSHQGVAVYQSNNMYYFAAYFTPCDFGLQSYFGQIFFRMMAVTDYNIMENFVNKNLVDKPGDRMPSFDIVLGKLGLYRLHDDEFMKNVNSFSDAMDSLDESLTSQNDKAILHKYREMIINALY